MQLTDAWDESQAGGGMRLAVVRGTSGAGRTELLRRCYEHCAWGQRYWPATLPETPADTSQPLTPDPFWVPDGVAIPHMWLALTGSRGAFPVFDAASQLADHLSALRRAVLASDALAKRRLLSALDAGLLVGSLLSLAQPAISTAMTVAGAARSAPGVVQNAWSAFTPRGTAIAQALAVNAGRIVNPGQLAEARDLASNEALSWARVAAIVPFLVAVDDAQELDPATITFLSKLLRHSGRGLMILAVNTDREPANGAAGGNEVLATWLSEQARMGPVTVVELDPVPDAEVTELAVHWLAEESISQVALRGVIEASAGAPGRLTTLLARPGVYRAVTHPDAVMPRELGRITRSDVLQQHWAQLSPRTREILAKLALCGPRCPESFRPSTVSEADAQKAAEDGWLRPTTIEFRSTALWEAAYSQIEGQLTDDQEEAVLDELSARVAAARSDGNWASFDPGIAEDLLEALIRGNGIDDERDTMADLIRLRRLTGREAASEGLLEAIHSRVSKGRVSTPLLLATTEALHDAGRDRQALELLEQRLEDAERECGEDSSATIAPLSNLVAYWVLLAKRRHGQPGGIDLCDHAISLCQRLIALRIQYLPFDDRRIPDTRIRLADLYGYRNRPRDAAVQLELVVTAYRKLLGPDHPQTLTSRNNLARAYELTGDVGRAVPLHEWTLVDAERVLGSDHPHTLTFRDNLVLAYRSAGDVGRAVPLCEQVLADAERVLGPEHPHTLIYRSGLAVAVHQLMGDVDRALPLHEQTLADAERVLGQDHPHTLLFRNNLARAYDLTGDVGRAVPLYEQAVADAERVLGPDHPRTLTLRTNLGITRRSGTPNGDEGEAPNF